MKDGRLVSLNRASPELDRTASAATITRRRAAARRSGGNGESSAAAARSVIVAHGKGHALIGPLMMRAALRRSTSSRTCASPGSIQGDAMAGSDIVMMDASRKAKRITFPLLSLGRSEEHTSELQSLMRTSYADFCLNTTTL